MQVSWYGHGSDGQGVYNGECKTSAITDATSATSTGGSAANCGTLPYGGGTHTGCGAITAYRLLGFLCNQETGNCYRTIACCAASCCAPYPSPPSDCELD